MGPDESELVHALCAVKEVGLLPRDEGKLVAAESLLLDLERIRNATLQQHDLEQELVESTACCTELCLNVEEKENEQNNTTVQADVQPKGAKPKAKGKVRAKSKPKKAAKP